MNTYACADCGAEFSDGEARDAHFMSPACPMRGRFDAVGDAPRNARIWEYINGGPVKLTLRPDQTLNWVSVSLDEEGHTVSQCRWHWDGTTLQHDWKDDASDCDGRMVNGGTLYVTADKFAVRQPYIGDAREADNYEGVRWPDWQRQADWQRDHAAEAAGY